MQFFQSNNSLIAKHRNETVLIQAWGKDALRVRATQSARFCGADNALETAPAKYTAEVQITAKEAVIRNGLISCVFHNGGHMEFYRGSQRILKEYYRDWGGANEHSPSLRLCAREFKPVSGSDYEITMRFEANEGEKIFGMGQYQQPNLDLKGCVLELAQRNSQISIPFYLSNKGYGFLWNNAGIGQVCFGANYTQWHSKLSEELDYWIASRYPKRTDAQLHRSHWTGAGISRKCHGPVAGQAALPNPGRSAGSCQRIQKAGDCAGYHRN